MSIMELKAARNYLERAHAILKFCGSVQADDVQAECDAISKEIAEMESQLVKGQAA